MTDKIAVVPTSTTHVTLYDMSRNGCFMRSVQVTTGQIMGAPIIAGDTCTIICKERGQTWRNVYKMPQFYFAMHNIIG